MIANILIMATPTQGDNEFFSRWSELGRVYYHKEEHVPAQIDVLVVDHNVKVTDTMICLYPNLKFIATANTAHTHIEFVFEGTNIEVLSLKGEVGFLETIDSTAEHTIYLMARLAKEIEPRCLLRGKTLAVIGTGRVGRKVIRLARGLGMVPKWTIDAFSTKEHWEKAFGWADFVSLHLSEQESSFKIVNGLLLNMMKPSAFLINTSRPSVLEELNLWSLCQSGAIKGAALDTYNYSELANLPNVITTPHIAGQSLEDRIKTDKFIVQKTRSALLRADYQLPSNSHAG